MFQVARASHAKAPKREAGLSRKERPRDCIGQPEPEGKGGLAGRNEEEDFCFLFCFLGLHPWHMEVPRPEVRSDLQLPVYTTAIANQDLSCICDLYHSTRQCQILNPLSEDRDRTHKFSWFLVGFLSAAPQRGHLSP